MLVELDSINFGIVKQQLCVMRLESADSAYKQLMLEYAYKVIQLSSTVIDMKFSKR